MNQRKSSTKVSVITVSYNSVETLEQTIQSVLNQTYHNLEYIIIDGGSTDGTVDIINKYHNKITYWVSEKDSGISDAFNKGLLVASGDIVGILNADDIYDKETVEIVAKEFTNDQKVDFVFGDMYLSDKSGNILHKVIGNSNYKNKIYYTMPAIFHPTVFVRKDVYDKNGYFNREYKTAMDYEFFLRITINNAQGLYIPHVLATMRLGGESSQNIIRGRREVMSASIYYGYNKYLAQGRFCIICLKVYVRKLLEKLGLHKVVKLYRLYIDRRYKST